MITTIKILLATVFLGLYVGMVFIGISFVGPSETDFNFTAVKIENINNQQQGDK